MNERDRKPHWKQIHRSRRFWGFLFLLFAGILYYIQTVDFAWAH